jgi:CDP-diacylglycerol--serine O-phosphatidyltransferase
MLIGLSSIYLSIKGDLLNAAWLIPLSAIMDKLDGTTARFFNASSQFGVEFDSFSDFVSFGIAPAILILSYFSHDMDPAKIPFFILGACAIYVVLSAMRLSKYNCCDSDDHEYFSGLTTTQNGGMLALFVIIAMKHNFSLIQNINITEGVILTQAILLVTPFRYEKIKKLNNKIKNTLMILAFVFMVLLILFRQLPEIVWSVSWIFLFYGVIKVQLKKLTTLKQEQDDTTSKENTLSGN